MSAANAPIPAARAPVPTSPRARLSRRAAWLLMAASAVGIALFAVVPYLTLDPRQSRIPINAGYLWHLAVLTAHAATGSLALLIGPFQFVGALRARFPQAHRALGRVYLACIFVGSVFAVGSSYASTSGLAAQLGFFLLAAGWAYSGWKALAMIRGGQVALHRVWMIRNYALTFAAVLLRVFLALGIAYRASHPATTFGDVYTASVWCSMFVALVTAEWFIVQRAWEARARVAPAERPRAHASRPAVAHPA